MELRFFSVNKKKKEKRKRSKHPRPTQAKHHVICDACPSPTLLPKKANTTKQIIEHFFLLFFIRFWYQQLEHTNLIVPYGDNVLFVLIK